MFLGGCVGLVFFGGFLLMFLLYFFGVSLPKLFGKILLMSGLVFSGFVLSSLGFFVVVVVFGFFSKDTDQVVTGHPFTRTCLSGSFSFLCPAAFVCSARFGRASRFLAFFRVPFWAPGGFGILLELMGLELVRSPLGTWDARRQGFSCSSSALFSFSPFCFAATLFLANPSRTSVGDHTEVGKGDLPSPSPE